MQDDLQAFGISDDQINDFLDEKNSQQKTEFEQLVIYKDNLAAFNWFDEVQDCLKYLPPPNGAPICLGLDLAQVAADLQINPRDYDKDDYQRLKRLGHYSAQEYNRLAGV